MLKPSIKISDIKVGQTIVLQKCKHSWLNGLQAKILLVDDKIDEIRCQSTEGTHLIGIKNIKS